MKCVKNVFASIFRHVDKVQLLNARLRHFYVSKTEKLFKVTPVGPGLFQVMWTKRFGNNLICWQFISVNPTTKHLPGLLF